MFAWLAIKNIEIPYKPLQQPVNESIMLPSSQGSLNAYHGTHALRERARKIHEGIIIIRYATSVVGKDLYQCIEVEEIVLSRLNQFLNTNISY